MASLESATTFESPVHSVISVQELTKKPILTVPKPFIQFNQENPVVLDHSIDSSQAIPIIDLQLLLSPDTIDLELEKLHSACKEWGFFQVVNHGVSLSLMEKMRYELEEFYKLPLEEKLKYKRKAGESEGYGCIMPKSGGAQLEWGDRFYMIVNPVHLRKPHLFPRLPPSLRETLEVYLHEIQELSMELMKLLAKALKINTDLVGEMFDDGMASVRMTYYPPCPQPELVAGITPHSDGSAITILNQVNGVDGLQVKKNGAWVPIRILPDALVVNIGDVVEVISNGIYKSIEHMARSNAEKERMSIAYFLNPKFEAEIGPAPALINPENPALYKTIGMEGYVKGFFSRTLSGKTNIDSLKLLTD